MFNRRSLFECLLVFPILNKSLPRFSISDIIVTEEYRTRQHTLQLMEELKKYNVRINPQLLDEPAPFNLDMEAELQHFMECELEYQRSMKGMR